jgi:hypothetical protein
MTSSPSTPLPPFAIPLPAHCRRRLFDDIFEAEEILAGRPTRPNMHCDEVIDDDDWAEIERQPLKGFEEFNPHKVPADPITKDVVRVFSGAKPITQADANMLAFLLGAMAESNDRRRGK